MLASLIGYFFAGLTAASILYCLVTFHAARRFMTRHSPALPHSSPPATILIPLCGTDFNAYDNYASFCRLKYPQYQIVFGVQNPQDSSIPVVRKIMTDFPDADITLVISSVSVGENPKVNNLSNMIGKARYPWLVFVDSDMQVHEDYLQKIIPSQDDAQMGLATCLYRAGTAPNLPAKLEALGIATDFAQGVMMANFIEGISFAFGATIVIHKEKLRALGGMQTIAPYLADDYMMGHLLWKMGYKIELLPHVVETNLPASTFGEMIRHQIRWARGIRAGRPLGYTASIITHTLPLALLNALYHGGDWPGLLLLGFGAAVRFSAAWMVGVKALGDRTTRNHFYLLPMRDCLGFFIWCMSIWGRKVEWRGRTYKIFEDGKIKPA